MATEVAVDSDVVTEEMTGAVESADEDAVVNVWSAESFSLPAESVDLTL